MTDLDAVRVSVLVACTPEHAFRTWTARLASWWPRDHTVSGRPDAEVTMQPWLGGRIVERLPDGTEHTWGEVTGWEPPGHLSYRWHFGRDPADPATEVSIRFLAQTEGGTRVDIEHTGWEQLGAEGPTWRARNSAGWAGLLPHYLHHLQVDPLGADLHGADALQVDPLGADPIENGV